MLAATTDDPSRAVIDQGLHGLEAALAGDNGETIAAILGGFVDADRQVLQQAEGGDGILELGVGLRVRSGCEHGRIVFLEDRDYAIRRT